MGEQNFLNVEQIIPAQEAAEFMIGIADKSRDEVEGTPEEKNRHKVRREFWKALREALEGKTTRFDNVTPGPYGSFGAGSVSRSLLFSFDLDLGISASGGIFSGRRMIKSFPSAPREIVGSG